MRDHKSRWVFGPMLDGVHLAGEYALSCAYPMIVDGHALAHCVFNAQQLRAARLDPRLTVLDSLHSSAPVPDHVTKHHAKHGVKSGMKLHDMLVALSQHHASFEPDV